MATQVDTFPTLVNVVRRMRPDGAIETNLANTLTKLMPVLKDMPMVEGNLPTGHRMSSVTALPSPTWRRLNQGLDPAKGETQPFDETCGLLEAISKIDVDLADLNGNAAAYRMSEDELFLEGMSQEASRSIFYENAVTNPERIHGLSARYPASTGYTASPYVIKSGSTGGAACRSIWVITWDPNRIFGIFPKASIGGLVREDKGKQYVLDSNSKQFEAYVTQFKWKLGFGVKDYRYAVRLQWDTTDTSNNGPTQKTLFTDLETALGTVWEADGRTRIYMDRVSRNRLAAQLANANTNYLQWATGPDGELIQKYLGVPIRITDTLVAETALA